MDNRDVIDDGVRLYVADRHGSNGFRARRHGLGLCRRGTLSLSETVKKINLRATYRKLISSSDLRTDQAISVFVS